MSALAKFKSKVLFLAPQTGLEAEAVLNDHSGNGQIRVRTEDCSPRPSPVSRQEDDNSRSFCF